jgi:hypothetical protein
VLFSELLAGRDDPSSFSFLKRFSDGEFNIPEKSENLSPNAFQSKFKAHNGGSRKRGPSGHILPGGYAPAIRVDEKDR